MKTLHILAALLISSPALADQPLTFWRYAGGDQMALQRALDCAISRWRAATCLPIDVSYDAAHWVRFAPDDQMGTNVGQTTAIDGWNSQRIKLRASIAVNPDQTCQMLVHEMSHVLRRSYYHSDEDGSMSYAVTHVFSSWSTITVGDLDAVCAKQPCGCFIPE